MQPVEKLSYDENSSVRFNTIIETELTWIKLLQFASLGFNDKGNISKVPDFDVFFLLEIRKRKPRSYHGKRQKGNDKSKRCAAQISNTSLNNLSTK